MISVFAVVSFVSFVFFVSFVSCYFGTRGTRETIGTGARSGISLGCRCLILRTAVQINVVREFAFVSLSLSSLWSLVQNGADGAVMVVRVRSFIFPIRSNERTLISLMWVITKILSWCVVITTLIKTVTLTYILTDIYIIILSIYIYRVNVIYG